MVSMGGYEVHHVEDTHTNIHKYLCPYAESAKYSMVIRILFRPNTVRIHFLVLFLGLQVYELLCRVFLIEV